MYNEATDVGNRGAARHEGFQALLDINLWTQVLDCDFFPCVFFPPAPSFLVLLSLTRCNFVVSSVPAGCDSPLLLIILNQGGLSLSLSPSFFFAVVPPPPFSLCRRQTKWRRMKHVRNLFKDSSEDGLSG